MNFSGISLVTNALVSANVVGEPGNPYPFALRAILDVEKISDAYAVLQGGVRCSSANHLTARQDGFGADIEALPGDFSRFYTLFSKREILLHAGHFRSDRLLVRDVSPWAMPDSLFRPVRLRSTRRQAEPPLSLDDFRTIRSDHTGYPAGTCCHSDERRGLIARSATVASILTDLDPQHIWVNNGIPFSNPCHGFDYQAFSVNPQLSALPKRRDHHE